MAKTELPKHVFVRLPLEGVSNCRDLGGYYSSRGQVTKWNTFLRSSRLPDLSEADIQFVYDYGLRSIIDLRADFEIQEFANPLDGHPQFTYYNVDLIGTVERASQKALSSDEPFVLGQMYVGILEDKTGVKQVLDIMMEEINNGGVMFHCSAGKDRTGVIALLVLGLAGVAKQDIITNYEVSGTNIKEDYLERDTNFRPNVLGSHPKNIIMAYDYIMENYLSFENYFMALGYSEEQVDQFLFRYLEDFRS